MLSIHLQNREDVKSVVLNPLMHLLYTCLLSQFSFDEIRKFWNQLSPADYGLPSEESQLYQHFWNIEGTTPQSFFWKAYNYLESFLNSKEISVMEFWDKSAKNGSMFDSRILFFFVKNMLVRIFNGGNPQKLLLELIPDINNLLNLNSSLRITGFHENTRMLYATYLFFPDISFSQSETPPDQDTVYVTVTKYIPSCFGLPQFDLCNTLADRQPILSRFNPLENAYISDNQFFINKKPYGKVVSLQNVCTNLEITLTNNDFPDTTIVQAQKDYFCPIRRRKLLIKGNYYGTPFSFTKLGYTKLFTLDTQVDSLKENITSSDLYLWSKLEQRHQKLVHISTKRVKILYKKNSNRITINGIFITSGIQGRILFQIIKHCLETDVTEFQIRTFTSDPNLISSNFNTGFGIRLKRIMAILEVKKPGVRIEKIGYGTFRILFNKEPDLEIEE